MTALADLNVRDGASLGTQIWVSDPDMPGRDKPLAPAHFKPVEPNEHPNPKPRHGLWTAQWDERHGGGWVQWCLGEQWGIPDRDEWDAWQLTPSPDARVLVIDSYKDLERVHARWPDDYGPDWRAPALVGYPAWHLIAKEFDGVHLTEQGQWRTRLTHPLNLYGWDCESTLWFRWAFIEVQHLGRRTFEGGAPYD